MGLICYLPQDVLLGTEADRIVRVWNQLVVSTNKEFFVSELVRTVVEERAGNRGLEGGFPASTTVPTILMSSHSLRIQQARLNLRCVYFVSIQSVVYFMV